MKMFEFLLKFSWKFVPKGVINIIPALVQIIFLKPARGQAIVWNYDD